MRKVICDHCGKDITHEQTNMLNIDNCFLLGEEWIGHGCELCDGCWEERERLHAQLDADFFHAVTQNTQEIKCVDTGTGNGVSVHMCHQNRFDLDDFLKSLQAGRHEMNVGDYFTTRLKKGMEVDFVCTDKDGQSYRFESRDCLARYESMTQIDRFFNAVWAELPDPLTDRIMEIIRLYEEADGSIDAHHCRLFLPSASEIFPADECYGDQGVYEQLEWYKDVHNRIRAYEKGGAVDWYWTQSPRSGNTTNWCSVNANGHANYNSASNTAVAAPVCFRIPRI